MIIKIVTVTINHEYYRSDSPLEGFPEDIGERIEEGHCFDWAEEEQRIIISKEIVEQED